MQLQDFITETLVQISEGVLNAKNKLGANGLQINPYLYEQFNGLTEHPEFIGFAEGKRIVQIVNFDVSVTVEAENNKQGNIKIASGFIEMGLLGKKKSSEQNISKIKFSIPISFPSYYEK
ncbi:MAG TPA: hypothetical protein VL442_08610 [Mucilaginibacter sp.]|jgi:hypothetical protein|nr:hypothetical protein [Mucilaginibacter sp.]